MKPEKNSPLTDPRFNAAPELVAVIDIGASSLRMQISEIDRSNHQIRNLESFSQAVSVGKDSFTKHHITKKTTESCVRVLKIYRSKLIEYGITNHENVRVIATSGVREATNGIAFTDRIFIATGFAIEPFDEAELHRVTYLGVLPYMTKEEKAFSQQSVLFEAGGGTAEILLLNKKDVVFSKTYRLGSLRLRQKLELFDAPFLKSRSLMESQILQTISEFKVNTNNPSPKSFIAMGGEVRFAASVIDHKPAANELLEIEMNALEEFTSEILLQSPDHLASRFHMSLPDAESLGPGLLTQLVFARELGVTNFYVANVNMRDGLIKEMASGRSWSKSIQTQIIRSALQLGRKYRFNEEHARHVSQLACQLFDQLQDLHQLPERYRGILELAALLHEIGVFISTKSKHKHSMYLILNSDFFGIGDFDRKLMALVARYHRGASPLPRHEGYSRLTRENRVLVVKMAAILRIAKSLDVGKAQRIESITCVEKEDRIVISPSDVAEFSAENIELRQVRGLFEDIFGKGIVLETASNQS
ncbi:MAG: exopolyphosphatase [Mariniblastus sp.]